MDIGLPVSLQYGLEGRALDLRFPFEVENLCPGLGLCVKTPPANLQSIQLLKCKTNPYKTPDKFGIRITPIESFCQNYYYKLLVRPKVPNVRV